jgi:hypothetical protein
MNDKRNVVPSWVWWLLGLVVVILVIIGRNGLFSSSNKLFSRKIIYLEDKNGERWIKTRQVIVLKPGDKLTLEINDKEWSPWIDATHLNMHYHAYAENGLIFKFRNGEELTVRTSKEERRTGSSYAMYQMRSPEGTGKQIAVIQTSN